MTNPDELIRQVRNRVAATTFGSGYTIQKVEGSRQGTPASAAKKAVTLAQLMLGKHALWDDIEAKASELVLESEDCLNDMLAVQAFKVAAGWVPETIPPTLNPFNQGSLNDPESIQVAQIITSVHPCFPIPKHDWECWTLTFPGRGIQLIVDLGPRPPPQNLKDNKPRHGFLKFSVVSEATVAMLAIQSKDRTIQVETKARMALRNSVSTDIFGWICLARNLWDEQLNTNVYRVRQPDNYAFPTKQGKQWGEVVDVCPGSLVEITSCRKYFRCLPDPKWYTFARPPLSRHPFEEI